MCGNGILEGEEGCDDGNGVSDDGCSECEIDAGWTCSSSPSSCSLLGATPEIRDFDATDRVLPGGGGATELQWNVLGADSLILLSDQSSEPQSVAGATVRVAVSQSTTYTLVATNVEGSVRQSVRIEVSSQGLPDWTTQGTSGSSQANGLTVDLNGGVYIAGWTQEGQPDDQTALVAKYEATTGDLQWTDVLLTEGAARANDIAVDLNGNMFLSGFTEGSFNGSAGSGSDGFLLKYSPMGELLWTELVNTTGEDEAFGVTIDSTGAAVVAGRLYGNQVEASAAFLSRYSTNGESLWLQELGAGADTGALTITTDPEGRTLTIAGYTRGNLAGTNLGLYDAFVAQYSNNGDLLWLKQFGTERDDVAQAVASDLEGNILLAGRSAGALSGESFGLTDAFVAKYSAEGGQLWVAQLGTGTFDEATAVAADNNGNVFIIGTTSGALGEPGLGTTDAFVAKYSAEGELFWTKLVGTAEPDLGSALAADETGNLFIAGSTEGALSAPSDGVSRSFVTRFR